MSLSSDPSSRGVTVVYVDYEGEEGEKAIFGSVRRMITRVGTLDATDLADNLEAFCRQMGTVFERVSTTIHQYELQSFEVALEVTAKGEVRFIGSAASEVKGGLKLLFARREEGSSA
jgi:hypothetical protein